MKISQKRKIDFAAVDSAGTITLHSLVKLFQDASILHSSRVAAGAGSDVPDGMVWVLYQYGIDVDTYPKYGEKIEIVTWIRQIKEYKIFREIEAYSGNRKIASACGVYLLYDVNKQKLRKIPDQTATRYPVDEQRGFHEDLDQWRPILKFDPEFETTIDTRLSDYDPMHHVNNSSYFDFVETLLFRYGRKEKKINTIKITYAREMNKTLNRFKAGLSEDHGIWRFKIWDEQTLFSYGELTLQGQR